MAQQMVQEGVLPIIWMKYQLIKWSVKSLIGVSPIAYVYVNLLIALKFFTMVCLLFVW